MKKIQVRYKDKTIYLNWLWQGWIWL